MRGSARPLVGLLAAGALLLGGCGTDSEPSPTNGAEQTQDPTAQSPEPEGAAPGDLLPDNETEPAEPTSEAPAPSEPTDQPVPAEPTEEQAEEPELGGPGIPACDVLDLPATTLPVIEDIEAGGPYDYPRNDGYTFQNREGILPDEDRDYYREFTVETPGLDHRGARRIVTGGFVDTDPEHWYFTGDHYESFCEFDPDLTG